MSKHDTNPGWVDPDDAPELTDEWFDTADLKIGDKIIRRGRPVGSAAANKKVSTTIRLDRDIIEKLKADGPGWQTRMNDTLRKALGV